MPTGIRIRAYNVLFGDCVLLSLPDEGKTKHLLFDFGNVTGKGGANKVFEPIARNLKKVTGGTLDLLVMTHEHLDHMEGFLAQRAVFDTMAVRRVWMSIPSKPDYYDKHPKSKQAFALTQRILEFTKKTFAERGLSANLQWNALLLNNLSNVDRINYVRKLAGAKRTHYLYRGLSTKGKHDFKDVRFRILAPEEEMSVYYGSALALAGGMADFRRTLGRAPERRVVPEHISATDFERLRQGLQTGDLAAVHEIDKAKNNTSLVVLVEAQSKKLLFTGDAEVESWHKMHKLGLLGRVDFLKVSHHGSWNGTPAVNGKNVLDILFPLKNEQTGIALVSTKSNVYGTVNKVPDEKTLTLLKKHCKEVYSTEKQAAGKLYVDIEL
ncbi:MAG TPA: hypothetical protein VNN18_03170 [Candidatus Xenobia bacterium]|nr:hypothetical protein [Candidatus Xenobia bacterium]